MTQFIQLEKLTTSSASEQAPFIFNRDVFLISEREKVRDASDGHQFIATRVTLGGHPEYTFYTLVDQDILATALNTVDVAHGINPGGSSCAGDIGVINHLEVEGTYPMLKLQRIINKVTTNKVDYLCNPNDILYAESYTFQDDATSSSTTKLIITFTGTSPRRIVTDLILADLSLLLEPTIL